jgi:TrmH family RNA methyltransferase
MITSLQNPKVKELIRLRDRRERDETGLYLIEGYRELLRFHETKHRAEVLYYCPELFLGENEQALIDGLAQQGALLEVCSSDVFRKISYRDRPDGLLGVAKQKRLGLKDLEKILPKDRAPFLVVAEAIEKPGNLGTILRSSDAAGVDALIVCDQCTDLFNPNVVRASVGTLFTVPVFEATSEQAIRFLKEKGIQIAAATPHAKLEFTQADFKQPLALAIGTEQLGLSDQWMKQADLQVRIPMCGRADSLNAAMASVILLYEVLRQRRC